MTGDETKDASSDPQRPPLRLVKGDASPEELAALIAVLSAVGGGEEPEAPKPLSQWASKARAVRRMPSAPGPGAWRASAWRG